MDGSFDIFIDYEDDEGAFPRLEMLALLGATARFVA